jgi:hypothetical protein
MNLVDKLTFDREDVPGNKESALKPALQPLQLSTGAGRIRASFQRNPPLRLFRCNEFLIANYHPLRETLMSQTGVVEQARRLLLNDFYRRAKTMLIREWEPVEVNAPPF